MWNNAKITIFTGKKYSEAWSVVNHCIFSKSQWFHCTSTVFPLYVFAVWLSAKLQINTFHLTGCAACLLALKFVKWLWHVQNLWIWLGSSIYLHSEAKTNLKLYLNTWNFLNSFHITSSDQTPNPEFICILKRVENGLFRQK